VMLRFTSTASTRRSRLTVHRDRYGRSEAPDQFGLARPSPLAEPSGAAAMITAQVRQLRTWRDAAQPVHSIAPRRRPDSTLAAAVSGATFAPVPGEGLLSHDG